MKKFLMVAVATIMVLAGLAPAAFAAPGTKVKFEGTGTATAFDLTVPAAKMLVGDVFPGITVGYTAAKFSSNPNAEGQAAGTCDLLTSNVAPLTACSGKSNPQTSSSAGNVGSKTPVCHDQTFAIVTLNTACGTSFSSVAGGRPSSINEANVAKANVNLPLDSLVGAENKQLIVSTLGGFMSAAVDVLPSTDVTDQARTDLKEALDTTLTNIAKGTNVADVKVGTSSTIVESAGTVTKVTSQAAGATIGLLGLNDALTDGIIIIDVSAGKAIAIWDDSKGVATASATPALAHIKIKDLLGICSNTQAAVQLVGSAVPCDANKQYIEIVADAASLQPLLDTLNTVPLLHTTVSVGKATQATTGKSVVATASGVEVHALKGLGETTAGAKDGGLDLRLATAGVTLAGDVADEVAAPLPLTGGPTYLFLGGALLLAAAAFGIYRFSLKLRTTA